MQRRSWPEKQPQARVHISTYLSMPQGPQSAMPLLGLKHSPTFKSLKALKGSYSKEQVEENGKMPGEKDLGIKEVSEVALSYLLLKLSLNDDSEKVQSIGKSRQFGLMIPWSRP